MIYVEVDSVSRAYAERHFPLTREYVSSIGGENAAFDFELYGIAGAASIANQMPLLSGCMALGDGNRRGIDAGMAWVRRSSKKEGVAAMTLDNQVNMWCEARSLPKRDPNMKRDKDAGADWMAQSPWIFHRAKARGYVTMFAEEFCSTNSAWALQTNFFDYESAFDYTFDGMYCALEDLGDTAWYKALSKRSKHFIRRQWQSDWRKLMPCLGGKLRHARPLEQIRNLFREYPDVPKFVFLNSSPAHDYSPRYSDVAAASESFDAHLRDFIKDATSTLDSRRDTIILLHSDHGLQGGPMAVEYSTQMEHRLPWGMLIAPRRRVESMKAAAENQKRLISPFDLYATMLSQIDESARVPEWSFNLLHEAVPAERTCKDAQIPIEYCPCENENFAPSTKYITSPHAPRRGVCNFVDDHGRKHCVARESV